MSDNAQIGSPNSEFLTEEEVARFLRIEPRTVRLWRRTRGLPHLKLTQKCIRFRLSDVTRWLDGRRVSITV
ncbi:MAG: helix-turn-helix domain-containing protein [Verrucomicrobiales bacterium]|nr:helix-turn-helix domain-containing protein [Verrucomicrobiales bacterium]